MTVAMTIVLLKYPILIKCWSCHRNKAAMVTKFIHIEGVISYTHKKKTLLLKCLSYDVVLSRPVLHYIK